MKTKVKQILCVLLLNSILLTVVFSAPAALANEKAFTESTTYSDASVSQSSASPPQRLVTNKKGEWIKASNGKYWYRHTDGSYTKNDWEYIDGSWYFFDANGWMLSSQWLKWNGDWYFLNPSGVMHTGWLKDNGKWYYLSSRGIMQTGWVKPDSYWYYLDSNGVMQTGWRKLNGSWYYFETTGQMRTTVLYQNQREYCFKSTGEMYYTRIFGIHQCQKKYNWCWAACAAMVGPYNINFHVTQEDIVAKYGGKFEWGTLESTINAVNYASNYTKKAFTCKKVEYNTLINYIDNNKPFILNIFPKDGGLGHMVVCSGYSTLGKLVHITDPAQAFEIDPATSGVPCFFNYDALFNSGIILNNTTYVWKETIVY